LPAPQACQTVFLLFLAAPLLVSAASTLDIYFIDVDHGNAVLVVSPSGESMLLDSGPAGHIYTERILETMKAAGVKQIDYFVVSHYHWDHFGTIEELSSQVPVLNFVDHGTNVEADRSPEFYQFWGITKAHPDYDRYVKVREKGKHMVVAPGDRLPVKGIDALVVTSAGRVLDKALAAPGAGVASPGCFMTGERIDNGVEDGQSVGMLLSYGKFRFIDLGDLTWSTSYRLFCPENKIGHVDVYMMTHHGLTIDKESQGPALWSASSDSPAEVYGLHPRAAVLSAGEDYVGRMATPEAWQTTRSSPGLEDIWELHYQAQGGPRNNSDEKFIACPNVNDCQGGTWIKVSAQPDGSFSITNKRNGFTKRYAAK
jgi:beta-lactamase superfamily II metal-dependent hydrolase